MAKKLKWNLILMSVLYLGLGIFLLMRPPTALNVVCYALGGVVLVCAAVQLVRYFAVERGIFQSQLTLISGIICLGLGAFLILGILLLDLLDHGVEHAHFRGALLLVDGQGQQAHLNQRREEDDGHAVVLHRAVDGTHDISQRHRQKTNNSHCKSFHSAPPAPGACIVIVGLFQRRRKSHKVTKE